MAKPFSAPLSVHPRSPGHKSSYRRHHRTHRRHSPSVAPSSGLLILLASVASASTANCSPAPPSFLCPSITTRDVLDYAIDKRQESSFTATPSADAIQPLGARNVPDRYSKDQDGVWRRVDSYTLYGSTVNACGTSCKTPTIASPVDDQIQVSGDDNSTSPSTTSPYDIQDSLPPGWKPVAKPYESRTPLILAMSLVLAFFICAFIIGCLFWRKSVKKKHKSGDVEEKARRRRHSSGDNDSLRELALRKQMALKSKQKLWARATARWRANIKYAARQRRGSRLSTRLSHPSTLSLDNSPRNVASSLGSSHYSGHSSPHSSTVSIPDQLRDEDVLVESAHDLDRPSIAAPTSAPATPTHPPAYGHIPTITISSESSYLSHRSRTPSMHPSAITDDGQIPECPSPTPLHVAHVATDDKALLARLADFASSPPEIASLSTERTSNPQVSAPAWDDEDISDIAAHLSTLSSAQSSDTDMASSTSMFPPPPSKERLAAAEELYTYPYFSFESMEAEAEPSAPPFEEGSTPLLRDTQVLLPSAPPLLEADELFPGPSAPDLDFIITDSPPMENILGQDHDRIPESQRMPGAGPKPESPLPPPSSSTSSTSTSYPTTHINIALPGYQP